MKWFRFVVLVFLSCSYGTATFAKPLKAFVVVPRTKAVLTDQVSISNLLKLSPRQYEKLAVKSARPLRFNQELTVIRIITNAIFTNYFDWIVADLNGRTYYAPLDYLVLSKFIQKSPPYEVTRFKGIPLDYHPKDLVRIPNKYCTKKGLKLRKEALRALTNMLEQARKDGVIIKVVSAYRSQYYQAWLYKRAIMRRDNAKQRVVAKPGFSEHHLGIAVDLGCPGHYNLSQSFRKTKAYKWLMENARKYGFEQSYPPGNKEYIYEPWHFRFVGSNP